MSDEPAALRNRRPRLTPEAEHLAEQERLLEDIADQLAEREAEFGA